MSYGLYEVRTLRKNGPVERRGVVVRHYGDEGAELFEEVGFVLGEETGGVRGGGKRVLSQEEFGGEP